ncbi:MULTISPECIES: DNA methyltransferase, partial [Klebsiella]
AVGQLVFTKNYASNRRNARARRGFVDYCHEGAYVLAKGRPVPPLKPLPDVLPFPYTGNTLHPTQKPVEALQPLIESFSAPGAIVLDPFAGSGSTCVAAYRAGRRYIGIEMLAQYHRAGTERLAAMHRAVNTPAANDEWLPEAA